MTDAEVNRVIEEARRANTELHIRDNNGKVIQNNYQNPKRGEEDNREKNSFEEETSELEILSNLSSSTEIEQDTKEHILRRSKLFTKTNPIVKLNNPVSFDYRKYRQKTERLEKHTGPRRQHGQQLQQSNKWTDPVESFDNRTTNNSATRNTAINHHSSGWTTASRKENPSPIGQAPSNHRGRM